MDNKNRKILLIDLALIGLQGGAHSEIYFMNILSILSRSNYEVYACAGNNKILRDNIRKAGLENCQVVDLNLKLLDKIARRTLLLTDKLIHIFPGSQYLRLASLINLMSIKRVIHDLGEDIPVFFAHTDSMMPSVPPGIARFFMPTQWVGLCVLPSYQSRVQFSLERSRLIFRGEKNFSLSSCRGILVLHPLYQHFFAKRFKLLPCFYLPELIYSYDLDKKEQITQIVKEIKERAKGRIIISILGSMTPRKNLPLFLESVSRLNPKKYFVIVLGRLKLKEPDLTKFLPQLEVYKKKLAKNSYINSDYYIQDEQEFSQLIQLSNIVFLNYDKHPFSSSILIKTMAQGKLVIVNKGYLMEKIVKQYNWKAAVEDDPDRIATTIQELTNTDFTIDKSSYLRFLADHSDRNFQSAILKVCNQINYNFYESKSNGYNGCKRL